MNRPKDDSGFYDDERDQDKEITDEICEAFGLHVFVPVDTDVVEEEINL